MEKKLFKIIIYFASNSITTVKRVEVEPMDSESYAIVKYENAISMRGLSYDTAFDLVQTLFKQVKDE